MLRRSGWLIFVLGALALRLAIVQTWHVPGGDGIQYYKLATQLREHHRFAYDSYPEPLTYSRLPGYPLFLAYVAVRSSALTIQQHVIPATRANAFLDVLTAGLVALLVIRLARRGDVAFIAFGAVIATPGLWLLSGYAMTETLATFLTTLEIVFAVLLLDGEHLLRDAIIAGVVAGAAQLVRADALTVVPVLAFAIVAAPASVKRRSIALLAFTLVATAIFLPWPIRNQQVFHHPYPFAAYWRTRDDGKPLPIGPILWARTWAKGAPGESFIDLQLAVENDIEPNLLLDAMWDDESEKQRVSTIFQDYNQERLSARLDHELTMLARERRARAPFRTYVSLPLSRLRYMWSPPPFYEMPMKVPWLWIGESRMYFWGFKLVVGALALLGIVSLWRSRRRALLLVLLSPIALRSVLLSYTVAIGATERHLVEIQPLLVLIAAFGVASLLPRRSLTRSADSR